MESHNSVLNWFLIKEISGLSTNGGEAHRYLWRVEVGNINVNFTLYTKFKWITDLSVNGKTIKLLGGKKSKPGENLQDIGLGKEL